MSLLSIIEGWMNGWMDHTHAPIFGSNLNGGGQTGVALMGSRGIVPGPVGPGKGLLGLQVGEGGQQLPPPSPLGTHRQELGSWKYP